MQVALYGVPHRLIQCVEWAVPDAPVPFPAAYWRVLRVGGRWLCIGRQPSS
jgi:hypothetical protein